MRSGNEILEGNGMRTLLQQYFVVRVLDLQFVLIVIKGFFFLLHFNFEVVNYPRQKL